MTAEWFRQVDWSDGHLAAFLKRNARSRGDMMRAQYVRLQAVTLFATHDDRLIQAALDLLNKHFFPLYSTTLDASAAFCCAGECSESLGHLDEAISFYQRALAREVELPSAKSSATFLFAKLVVEAERTDLVDEAVLGLDRFGSSPFPWHRYVDRGTRAVQASARGDMDAAGPLAVAALEAASIRDTGLGHGRGALGTVTETGNRFHRLIERLAGA